MYLIGITNCGNADDFKLMDITSRKQMETNGWSFNIDTDEPQKYKETCGSDNTWYGFSTYGIGRVSATFTGKGTATLDYGNCLTEEHLGGYVNVKLNNQKIDVAPKDTTSKLITFDFNPMDVLLLDESTNAIIKLNSLKITCRGKHISMYKQDVGANIYQSRLI